MPIKEWTKEDIKDLLENNHTMVIKSLLELYKLQTEDEKFEKTTGEGNGVGFNKFDAEILTNIAEFYQKHNKLSFNQLQLVRKKIMKYAGQLANIANKEAI